MSATQHQTPVIGSGRGPTAALQGSRDSFRVSPPSQFRGHAKEAPQWFEGRPALAISEPPSPFGTRAVSTTRCAATRKCRCGAELPASRGRQWVSCSPRCKRRRDALLKKVERRKGWRALWLTSTDDPAEVAAAVADLDDDIGELLLALGER